MNNIRRARFERDMPQKQVAAELGVSQATVSDWEADRARPSSENLIKLSRLFSCTTDYLLGISTSSLVYVIGGTSGEQNVQNETRPVYDDEAYELMREMYERPELRALFRTSKNVKPDDIRAVDELLKRLAGNNEDT